MLGLRKADNKRFEIKETLEFFYISSKLNVVSTAQAHQGIAARLARMVSIIFLVMIWSAQRRILVVSP